MNEAFTEFPNSKNEYSKRKDDYNTKLERTNKQISLISLLRGVVFLAGIGTAIYLYIIKKYNLIPIPVSLFILIFLILVIKHEKKKSEKKYISLLWDINEASLKRLEGEWKEFKDCGEDFSDENHAYSEDLDIFGKGSLFQWINTSCTYLGRKYLEGLFVSPDKDIVKITERQKAVSELSLKLDWRQMFQAEGMLSDKSYDPEELFNWSCDVNEYFRNVFIITISKLLPIATITLLILAIAVPKVHYYPFLSALSLQIFLLVLRYQVMAKAFTITDRYKDNVKAYERMLKLFEEEKFKDTYLKDIQMSLRNDEGQKAYRQIKGLTKVVEMISMRYSELYLVFNIITLWDYQCLIALEKWKKESGRFLKNWLYAIGEVEALSSISIIGFDNPEWVMPEISKNASEFSAKGLGHPLLPPTRVCNDLSIEMPGGILLITGSNMSGKSTLLRTTGISLVMAYAGAPVCAREFRCPVMDIYSSMRVKDNLEKNISSFYAELLRIKMILSAAKGRKPVFFLLDEIFKGTNSRDRHTGAKILIKSLSKEGASGIVSTHDLELGDLAAEAGGKIKNYHFREYYEGGGIHFDYRLRPGVSTTRNAIYLMKLAGINITEETL